MSDQLKMHSPNLVDSNIEKIAALFPNCVTEAQGENGELKKAIDFDLLKQELSQVLVEGEQERYRLDWVGKKESILTANAPIAKTLRPCREESVNFDTTENLFIEGDNLEALKLLQENYLGKVKMIYIDPPYNTGNDFIYEDDFAESTDEFFERSNQTDEEGNKLVANTDSNGRFHSDWLSMMNSRLKLARNLLSDKGLIFISIDNRENSNLRKLCDEIFGASNFISEMIILTGANQSGEGVKIQTNNEYCLVYAKDINIVEVYHIDPVEESLRNLNDAPTPLETRLDMGYTIYYHPQTKDLLPIIDYDKKLIHINIEDQVYTDCMDLLDQGYVKIRPGMRSNKLHRWRWGIDTFKARINEIVITINNSEYSAKFKQSGFNAPKNIINVSSGTTELKS
ncbi:site-specific DNA-methyltransferase, partial [Acinetobacter ursingii]|uniref:site-specific DNA-methyltransferase n=3 Tax=Acinetobacter TaxID=469 RepID=UPI00300B4C6F